MFLGFLDHLQSDMVHFLSQKPLNSEPDNQDASGTFHAPYHPQASGMWMSVERWNIFFFRKSLRPLSAAMPREGSSHLGHFMTQ